ncbi:unnamed protein product [Clonostachys rhizophaga]|uniref:Uncharacterized protein n=1 Tax=Clonostachys rhizophaga TaxID=160324 RepID=A0A9N9W1U2_9HYPO|nr:unnamed protein product [Clonostachys rhizophaga]
MPLGNIPLSTNIGDYSSKKLKKRWPKPLAKKYRRVPSPAGWPEKVLREDEEYYAVASRLWVEQAKNLSEESRKNFIEGLKFLRRTSSADHCLTTHTLARRYESTRDIIFPILLKIVYSSEQYKSLKPFSEVKDQYPGWNPDSDDASFNSWVPKEYIKEPPSGQMLVTRSYLKGELTRVGTKLEKHIDEKAHTLYLDLKVKLDLILSTISILGRQDSNAKGTSTAVVAPLPKPTSHGTIQTGGDEDWEDIPDGTSRKKGKKREAAGKAPSTATQLPDSGEAAPAGASRKKGKKHETAGKAPSTATQLPDSGEAAPAGASRKKGKKHEAAGKVPSTATQLPDSGEAAPAGTSRKNKKTPKPSGKQTAIGSLSSDEGSDIPLLGKVNSTHTGADLQKSSSAPPGATRTPLPNAAPTSRLAKAGKPSSGGKRKTPSPAADHGGTDEEFSTPSKRPKRRKTAPTTVQATPSAPTTIQATPSVPATLQETPAPETTKKKKVKVRDTIEGSPPPGSAEFDALEPKQKACLTRIRRERARLEEDLRQGRALRLKEKLENEEFKRKVHGRDGRASSAVSFDDILEENSGSSSHENADAFKTPLETYPSEKPASLSVQPSLQEQAGSAFGREPVPPGPTLPTRSIFGPVAEQNAEQWKSASGYTPLSEKDPISTALTAEVSLAPPLQDLLKNWEKVYENQGAKTDTSAIDGLKRWEETYGNRGVKAHTSARDASISAGFTSLRRAQTGHVRPQFTPINRPVSGGVAASSLLGQAGASTFKFQTPPPRRSESGTVSPAPRFSPQKVVSTLGPTSVCPQAQAGSRELESASHGSLSSTLASEALVDPNGELSMANYPARVDDPAANTSEPVFERPGILDNLDSLEGDV